jgi:hypothetical protein
VGDDTDPNTYVPQLVDHLVSGINDDGRKLKIINDWIGQNIYYDKPYYLDYEEGMVTYSTTNEIFYDQGRTTCGGYAHMFQDMCEFAGLNVGYLRVYSRSAFWNGSVEELEGHSCNVVNLNDEWYMTDVTWGSNCSWDGENFIKEDQNTLALFLEPEYDKYLHYPMYVSFLEDPISEQEYNDLPKLRFSYHQYEYSDLGIELTSHVDFQACYEFTDSIMMEFESSLADDLNLYLYDIDFEQLTGSHTVEKSGNTITATVEPDSPGWYYLRLYYHDPFGDPRTLAYYQLHMEG